MRDQRHIEKMREAMQQRVEENTNAVLRLIYQSKRDALGAICNDGKDPAKTDQNLENALVEVPSDELDLPSYVKIQAARNAFAWVQEDMETI